ncbi:MAG: FAD:protein FMN transferase [Pseudomonadota bacterium]|nr:FAD:protein FMN transferase [Pseudomonadota bacterium]
MKRLRKLAVGLGLAALVIWLALRPQSGVDDRLVEREFLAMGTILSVSLYLDKGQDRPAAEQVLRDLQATLDAYAQRWSAWGNGTLGKLNQQLAGGAVIEIPPDLQPLFAVAARYSTLSGGRFDIRVGKLTELWGFNDETRFRSAPPEPAQTTEITHALAAAPALSVDAVRYGPAAGIWLDFGAIAKGDATDLAIAELRRKGYPNAIVNAGGNLRAAGQRGKRPWRVGVRHPRPDADNRVLSSMDIRDDEAVITSGDYERYFDFQGQRYHHLLDPHSGMPASGLRAVTVIASSGALADAASTALFVAGPQAWRQVASDLGISQAFVVLDDGRIQISAALAPRMQFADGAQVEILP